MFTIEQKVDALLKLAVCSDPAEAHELRGQIVEMVLEGQLPKDTETAPPKVETKPSLLDNIALEDTIIDLLLEMGVPTNLLGYRYLVYAIELVYDDVTYLDQITNRLYVDVAKRFNTKGCRAERAIRHGVEVAFERGNLSTIQNVFSYTIDPNKGKPTNSQFISTVVEYIRRTKKG